MKAIVRLPDDLEDVAIRRRVSRFAVEVERRGRRVILHLPNSGRMTELLVAGTPGLATVARVPGRRTRGTLWAVRYAGRWVSVDSHMPNRLFLAGLAAGALPEFAGYDEARREVRFGASRLDFMLQGPSGTCYVETKSCNLVERGVAWFPDAPTARGAQHLRDLAAAVRAGHRAAVVWFVQRDDARVLRPYAAADPVFARELGAAGAAGVEAHAYGCRVTRKAIRVAGRVRVEVR